MDHSEKTKAEHQYADVFRRRQEITLNIDDDAFLEKPHYLRTCGEFGNFFFRNVRHLPLDGPGNSKKENKNVKVHEGMLDSVYLDDNFILENKGGKAAVCKNATSHYSETLYVATAMTSGTSEANPYHLLHLTVPAYWQLQNKNYGVCADPYQTDIRFQFIGKRHQDRMNHFWR